jgi:hypothetical protein
MDRESSFFYLLSISVIIVLIRLFAEPTVPRLSMNSSPLLRASEARLFLALCKEG